VNRRCATLSAALLLSQVACGPSADKVAAGPALREHTQVTFQFSGPGAAVLSSADTRGRVTLLALITTYDMGSQVLARRLEELYRGHRPRLNVGAVALEGPRYEVLVGLFPEAVGLSYPVVMADAATLDGRGPFGASERVPRLFVLDADGRIREEFSGVPAMDAIQRAVKEAQASR
jgi:hypothetical protein